MTGQMLDPFAYWPAQRSRIRRLGGKDKADDPNYVFHTNYVAVPTGPSMTEVTFDDLTAESGMIGVRVFQHMPGATPAVTEHGKMTAILPSIAKNKRPIKVRFEAQENATYAIVGYVFGDCEAQAKAINIQIGPRPTEVDDPLRARSEFGRLKARFAAGLSISGEPDLSWPLSQGYTPEQLRETDFTRLAGHLPADQPAAVRWETAYILRVLEQYGRLEPGARGLALSAASDPAAAYAARAGCDIRAVVVEPGEDIAAACTRALPHPDEARGFDFIWTRSDVFRGGGSPVAIGMIEELLERMRPGGLGIHLVTTAPDMDRHALNRISLSIAAMGHIVAQLRHMPNGAPPVPFGIVLRSSTDDIIT